MDRGGAGTPKRCTVLTRNPEWRQGKTGAPRPFRSASGESPPFPHGLQEVPGLLAERGVGIERTLALLTRRPVLEIAILAIGLALVGVAVAAVTIAVAAAVLARRTVLGIAVARRMGIAVARFAMPAMAFCQPLIVRESTISKSWHSVQRLV